MREENTFKDYNFDDWVCEDVRNQIREFWGCWGRTPKDWLANANTQYNSNEPKYGQYVVVIKRNSIIKGRYIHAWNNMGRVISDNGDAHCVSTCDTFLDKAPSAELYSIN